MEIAPEGTGYRMRNRFCKFYNLPELMQIFSLFADVKLIEDLNIPRPTIHTEICIRDSDVTDILKADRFILNHEEQQYLLSALKEKYQFNTGDLYPTILRIADKYLSESYHDISNQDRSFVLKSIAYVISKKLQLDPSVIPVVSPLGIKDNKQFVTLGSKVNLVSRKILDELETEIKQIRSCLLYTSRCV